MQAETRISKSIREMQPYYSRIPRINELKLAQTPNTVITCTLCRGTRLVATESSVFHTYTFKKCYICNGSGVMSNNVGSYDRR
jgi:hypothetical protein